MTEMTSVSRDELRNWLRARVAFYLDRPEEKIDPTVDLSRYGMDSVYAISVFSDIEDHLHIELDPGEARKHATIDALADYLHELVAR